MIWIIFAILSVLAVIFLLLPLVTRTPVQLLSQEVVPAVLVDQLDEVQRDLDRGLISPSEAAAATSEIKRRILTASRQIAQSAQATSGEGRALIVVLGLLVPAMAYWYYSAYGYPAAVNFSYAELQEERDRTQEVTDLTQKLFDRLSGDPEGGPTEGWQILGQTYMRMGRFEDATAAFEIITSRDGATSADFSMLAESSVNANQGTVLPEAKLAIAKALELDPLNPAAVFYQSVSLGQSGKDAEAYDVLVALLETAEEFEPWMQVFVIEASRIGAGLGKPALSLSDFVPMGTADPSTAPGPSSADVAAAQEMTEADRAAFIRSMVERLASRLKDEPDDLQGWMRLANAYTVLGETGPAIAAYETADKLLSDLPASDPQRQEIQRALADLNG